MKSRCRLSRLLLNLANVKGGRFGTDVVDARRESRVAKESLKEVAIAFILLEDATVFVAQVGGVLNLQSSFAFKLADVFCLVSVSFE